MFYVSKGSIRRCVLRVVVLSQEITDRRAQIYNCTKVLEKGIGDRATPMAQSKKRSRMKTLFVELSQLDEVRVDLEAIFGDVQNLARIFGVRSSPENVHDMYLSMCTVRTTRKAKSLRQSVVRLRNNVRSSVDAVYQPGGPGYHLARQSFEAAQEG